MLVPVLGVGADADDGECDGLKASAGLVLRITYLQTDRYINDADQAVQSWLPRWSPSRSLDTPERGSNSPSSSRSLRKTGDGSMTMR